MPTPRAVARDLRRTAGRVQRIADAAVQQAATEAVEAGARAGGRFGRSLLTVTVRDVSNRRGTSAATVAGKTASAWSIKSYGRTGGYVVRPRRPSRTRALDLRRARLGTTAAASVRPSSTSGDDRWSRFIAAPTAERFPTILDEHLGDALAG